MHVHVGGYPPCGLYMTESFMILTVLRWVYAGWEVVVVLSNLTHVRGSEIVTIERRLLQTNRHPGELGVLSRDRK